MLNWLTLRSESRASYRNTLGLLIAFIILGLIYFRLLDGVTVFLGSHNKPRMLSSMVTITLSVLCTALAVLFAGVPRLPEQKRHS